MIGLSLLLVSVLFTILSESTKEKLKKKRTPKGISISRVSTAEQKKGTSLEKQDEWGDESSQSLNVPLVKKIKLLFWGVARIELVPP